MNFKDIHIGSLIRQRTAERKTEIPRICNFLKCTEENVEQIFLSKSLDTELLLKWCKLLEYDFFRPYSQHLILYAPPANKHHNHLSEEKKSALPQFRKNIYTKEVIDFILELVETGEKTKNQVIEEYKIPKTTLYKWISKYKNNGKNNIT